ncbi:DUF5683 domain-containing protein [Chitinophagaceae bacterium MMS25-I14]
MRYVFTPYYVTLPVNNFTLLRYRYISGCFYALLFCVISLPPAEVAAQAVPDTLVNQRIPQPPDTAKPAATEQVAPLAETPQVPGKKEPFQPNPKKSGLYSAILPGSGQLYNRQYWKIPVIYAGIAVAGYFIVDNTNQYRKYRKIYIARLQGDRSDGLPYLDTDIKTLQDEYQKYLDMTVLFTSLGYIIQVLDAITFAHLKNFDVSPDISMRVQPVAMPNNGIGLGLVVHFN